MSNDVNITESDLHAYIDGELDAGRAQAVAAGLSADPALAKRVAAYQADMAMLKKLYGPMAEQPGRPYLALVENARPRPAFSRRLVGAIAAAALIALAIGPFAYRMLSSGPAAD